MFTAAVIVAIVLAALLGLSAARKLSGAESVISSYARAGVPAALVCIALAAGWIAFLAS